MPDILGFISDRLSSEIAEIEHNFPKNDPVTRMMIAKRNMALNKIQGISHPDLLEKAIASKNTIEIIKQLDGQLGQEISADIKSILFEACKAQADSITQQAEAIPTPPPLPPRNHKKIKTVKLELKEDKIEKQRIPLIFEPKRPPTSISPTEPEFRQRLPSRINPKKDMIISSSGREASLVSPKEFKALQMLQKVQLQKRDSGERIVNKFYTSIPDPNDPDSKIKLRYPVFIGKNGQMIAIMESQQLGRGAFGTVFIGMDLETSKLVAIKEQNPKEKVEKDTKDKKLTPEEKKARIEKYKADIREEIDKLTELNRLVSSIEEGDKIFAVDELAWGKDYEKEVDKLRGNTSEEANLKRMDMAIKFLQQIDKTHQKDGLLHRDIKLGNMQWDDENKEAKVFDFGFAVARKTFKETLHDKMIMGTPIYMSPEVIDAKYSVGSDIYACGVALIEIFSKNNINTLYQEWDKRFNAYYSATEPDPTIITDFFKLAAPDLFSGEYPEDIAPIVELIHKMIDPNVKNRPALSEMINAIKQQKYLLEHRMFLDKEVKAASFSITPAHIENPYIKKHLYFKIKENTDNKFLDKIDSASLYVLLKQATIDNNAKVFDLLVKRFGLFKESKDKKEQDRHPYAQSILKSIVENSVQGKGHDLLYNYLVAAKNAGKLDQARQDIDQITKSYYVHLEKDVKFADKEEQDKHKAMVEQKEKALQRVLVLQQEVHQSIGNAQSQKTRAQPFVYISSQVTANKDFNTQLLLVLNNLIEKYQAQAKKSPTIENSMMVVNLLRLATQIEKIPDYANNKKKIDISFAVSQWNASHPEKQILSEFKEQLKKEMSLHGIDSLYNNIILNANKQFGKVSEMDEFKDIIESMRKLNKYSSIDKDTNLGLGDFLVKYYPYPPSDRNKFINDVLGKYYEIHKDESNNQILSLMNMVNTINHFRIERDMVEDAAVHFQEDPEKHEVTLEHISSHAAELLDRLKELHPNKDEFFMQCLSGLKEELEHHQKLHFNADQKPMAP